MKGKGIKSLPIDLGGVLINLDRGRCIESFKKIGFQNIEEEFCIHQLDGMFLQRERGLTTPTEFRDGIQRIMGKMVSGKQIDATWNNFLVDTPAYRLDLLLKLHEKYVVYLLSNANDIHWKRICENAFPYRTFKVEDYLERAYLSYGMRMAKPEPEILKAVTEDADIDPKETFFIDGSGVDYKVAQGLGISTYTSRVGEDWSHLFKKK